VAALIVAAIILLIVFLRKKRKNKKSKTEKDIEQGAVKDEKHETVVLENVPNTVMLTETNTTLTTYQPGTGTETLKSLTPGQIPFNELEIGNDIGEGNCGRVCVGKWKKYRVALKFCQNRGKMEEFLREANLMISLPPHPNVVRMYGVSIDGTQPIIVMEYCAGGSLDKLLYDSQEQISKEQKMRWVHEIALGMCHLHKHNIVHRDLAARNILLLHPYPNDSHLKISDFGMSRVLRQSIEGKTLNRIGPIRWMAPESIRDQVYSKYSDVWMFGVLVFEIVAQHEPHVDIDPNEVSVLIRDKGMTPKIPSKCPQKLRELMQMCWQVRPEQRPSFEAICAMLEQ
jgi:mitogen-activated protein kinase kinase kinase 9